MDGEDEDEMIVFDNGHSVPFQYFLHRAVSFLRRQNDMWEEDMLNTAISESMDTYREKLFSVDDRRRVDLNSVVLEEDMAEECHLCLEAMKKGDSAIHLPCGHSFHSQCIHEMIIHQHVVCPLCRRPIPIEKMET